MEVRGLAAALNSNGRYKAKLPESVVDHLVVGGGVVGMAIAQRLTQCFPNKTTYLVERHPRAGEETSSRGSEVIHAGLYYPHDSLKTRFCIRGRQLIYERCAKHNIPFRKTGKLVVAHAHQREYIETLHAKAKKLEWPPHSSFHNPEERAVPTKIISGDQARELEPDLSKDIVAALWSPETGILDSHAMIESLEKDIMESENSELVYSTKVVRVEPLSIGRQEGWAVQTVTGNKETADSDAMLAKTLINASGLSGPFILNSLLPVEDRIPMFYARGSYASYNGPGVSNVSRLLYPCPDTGKSSNVHFQSLGTHLTIDMAGKLRFGPDLDWISPPSGAGDFSYEEEDVDYWQRHLAPSESKLREVHQAVTSYLPGVTLEGLQPAYCGIRPKLVGPGTGFQDFVIRVDQRQAFPSFMNPKTNMKQTDSPMISLLGIESPGLTSSLAIAEYIVDDILGGRKDGVQ